MRQQKQYLRVVDAIGEGLNTSRDIVDVTGLKMNYVSYVVSALIKEGQLKRTGRSLSNGSGRGRRLQMFEPADQHREAAE